MSTKTAVFLQVAISIAFAIAIVIASNSLDGSGNEHTVVYLLIALCFVPNSWLARIIVKNSEKWFR